jgi:hypothetical protein
MAFSYGPLRQELLKEYISLGPDRSATRLWEVVQKRIEAGDERPYPTKRTIKEWIRLGFWARLASQHDADMLEKTVAELTAQGVDASSLMELIREDSMLALARIKATIMTVEVARAGDIRALADAARCLIEVHEYLRGTVTEKEDEATAQEERKEFGREHAQRIAESLRGAEKSFAQWHKKHVIG